MVEIAYKKIVAEVVYKKIGVEIVHEEETKNGNNDDKALLLLPLKWMATGLM